MHSPSRPFLLLPLLTFATLPLPAQAVRHAQPADTAQQALPIRRVALYKNGVGFFQHIGTVHGDSAVRIDFTTAQLNDVLQSLTAVDLGGGRIAGAGYNSTTPLEQQLRSLPLGLSADPTSTDLYGSIRGAHVEVTGAGAPITGRILNVELRSNPRDSADPPTPPQIEKHFLTVVSDTGAVRTVELTGNTSVRLLDPGLRGDLGRYLETLATDHADGLRHLTLMDRGTGTRELRVSYISEVPVWKCTYRILFDNAANSTTSTTKTATLQGWAVVDNTVGADWDNVELSLIAGAPQSFLQPISQPYYSRRPEIGLPEEAQLTPQTHESGEPPQQVTKVVAALDTTDERPASPKPPPAASLGGPVPQAIQLRSQLSSGHGSGNGFGVGIGGGYAAGPVAAPIAYEDSASASITPNTSTSSFDDYFEYKLNEPVTIRKNESALVPILQTKVDVDPVTLWSPNQPRPLRALWLKNTGTLTLDRGSFSIVQSGNFSGQGLLDPIHPGERRLLSYAADEAVRVSTDNPHNTQTLQKVTISKGILKEEVAEVAEEQYLVHNAAPDSRTVIVEQPRRPGWTLDSDPKPEETTATLYRFRVAAAPGQTVRLHIGERHTRSTRYAVASFDEAQITAFLRQNGGDSSTALAALQPVFTARRKLADIDTQIAQRNAEVGRIADDQNRLRENLKALKGTAEERDLTRRYTTELNTEEDRLTTLKSELTTLQTQRQTAQSELAQAVDTTKL